MNRKLISVLVFLTLMCSVELFEYKCYRDICDSTKHFCNDEEERCEFCGPMECSGQNNHVKFKQCEIACKNEQDVTSSTMTPPTTPPMTLYEGYKLDPISFITLIIVILIFIRLIFKDIFVIFKRKEKKVNEHPDQKPLLPESSSTIANCTEDLEKQISGPPEYETNPPIPEQNDSSSESHPVTCNFLDEDAKCSRPKEDDIHNVTPKTY